ncbi:MAG: right-handed parallel beta-helix repeat-containing protein [Acidimicrobiia bacterium]
MFFTEIDPNRTRQRHRLRVLMVAAAAAAAILIPAQQRAEAAEVCTGPECDTVAFVNDASQLSLYQDLVPSSPIGTFYYGDVNDELLMGDWNCSGEQTPGMYRRSTGSVYLRNSNTPGVADLTYVFGNPGDVPVVGDFDGDGCDTLGIYRPSQSRFFISNSLSSGVAEDSFAFGTYGDMPIVGDFDGDGVDTVGIYRTQGGFVGLRNNPGGGTADLAFYFGDPGDQLIAGDWDGDGVDTIAAYRVSNGTFYLRNDNRTGIASYSMPVGRFRSAVSASGIGEVQSAPAPAAPVSTGGVVSVAGFAPPPPRAVSGPIDVSESGVVIENLHISNPGGVCVTVTNASNVTIRNSTIGPCGDEAVYLSDVDGAVVEGNYITGTGNGVLVHRSDSVRVDSNAFVDAGRNFVQFDKVNGAGSSISGNRGQNELGGTNAEDLISLYLSNGTASSPIRVVGNHLRNGGPSDSGSGIMLGDGGGSYQFVEGNVLVEPGQVGIGVASGTNMTVRGNVVYSSALPWSNSGIYVWNQYDQACGNVEVSGNRVNWTNADGRSNSWWEGGGCGEVNNFGNDWDAPVGPNDF